MHELSITQAIVEACSQRAGDAHVLQVTVEIGTLSCLMPDSLRFCFDIVAEGTPCEGATLEIIPIPGLSRCRTCGSEVAMQAVFTRCVCGSGDLEAPRGGDTLNIKSMELAEPTLKASLEAS